MRIALFVLLVGCNEWYGLDPTTIAPPGDARPDAPPVCGATLAFSPAPHPIRISGGYALTYHVDESRSIAIADQSRIMEGTADADDLRPAIFEPALATTMTLEYPRLAPEGDELFVRVTEPAMGYRIERYTRTGATWSFAARLTISVTGNSELSSPSRRLPDGRRIVIDTQQGLQEYVESAPDTWTAIGAPFDASFSPQFPNLTADALHVIYVANDQFNPRLRYLSRADVTQPFGAPQEMIPFFGRPPLYWPFLTSDCGRLYLLIPIEGVFFLSQS